MKLTFDQFAERVQENRFIVQEVTQSRFKIYSIETTEDGEGFYLRWWANPSSKNGYWTANGGGYNKGLHVLQVFALEEVGKEAADFIATRQRFNMI